MCFATQTQPTFGIELDDEMMTSVARTLRVSIGLAVAGFLTAATILPTTAAERLSFEARSIDGDSIAVEPGKLWAVCFLGTECPMARSYASVLSELQDRYAAQGVQIVGVMSNVQDSASDLAAYANELQVRFPIVHDPNASIADAYGATRTPEVYLLDESLLLRYHGRINDQYAPGVVRSTANRQDLQIAIDQLLAGKPVSVPNTVALGCVIGRARKSSLDSRSSSPEGSVTFSNEISRVLARNCTECHRVGDIAPFSMEDYDEVVGWADTMLETVENGRMPPWHATDSGAKIANARRMPEEDKQLLRDWIASGLPEGDPSQLPAPLEKSAQWEGMGEPDAVFAMRDRPFVVPADGVVEYQYFVVDPKFETDKWIATAAVTPGSRDVVHHAIVFVRPPDDGQFKGIGWLTAYVPGQRAQPLPAGHARKIPAGSKFIFQMHYTPNGTERKDITRLGIKFADESEVSHEVYTIAGLDQEFEIPPGASDHLVTAEVPRLPLNAELLSATPHMHFRGKSFRLFAEQSRSPNSFAKPKRRDAEPPNGTRPVTEGLSETLLLDVPAYDFNWQHTYYLANPLPLDGIEGLRFEATFDNTQNNPFNPDPSAVVTWGDQTWEEMAVAFFDVAVPIGTGVKARTRSAQPEEMDSVEQRVAEYVNRVMESMDVNGDGEIRESEAPIVVRHGGFYRWDLDRDGIATRQEVTEVAKRLYQ